MSTINVEGAADLVSITNVVVPASFNRFSDLPKELRLMIWKFALPPVESRIVPIEPYNVGRSLTRIWHSRSTFIESSEAWQAFLDTPHIKDLPDENADGKLRDVIIRPGDRRLWNVHPTCSLLQNLMDTYDLVHLPEDTFYISRDTLYDPPRTCPDGSPLVFSGGYWQSHWAWGINRGGRYESGWCWDLDLVETLAIGKATFGYEGTTDGLHDDWVESVVSWFPNAKQVILALEYELAANTDASDMVFMDRTETEQAEDYTLSVKKPQGYAAYDDMWLTLFYLKEFFSKGIPTSLLESVPPPTTIERKIIMSSRRKADFSDVKDWYNRTAASKMVCLTTKSQRFPEPLNYIANGDTKVKDLLCLYSLKRLGIKYDDKTVIEVYFNGSKLGPESHVFDIDELDNKSTLHVDVLEDSLTSVRCWPEPWRIR